MVAKKKATKKTTKKSVKPKTKVVYRTRTVYKKAPMKREDESPFGGVIKDTSAMVGLGVTSIIGLGVAGAVGKSLNNI